MGKFDIKEMEKASPLLGEAAKGNEVLWVNPAKRCFADIRGGLELGMKDIDDAEARLKRFAPFIMKCFPETADRGGIIESPLREISSMKALLNDKYGAGLKGRLMLKMDSHLAIAGSVKARGGIYEVLKHTEDLALEAGILKKEDDYAKLADPSAREFFSQYTVQVGSTGNLGMSIGIMSAAVGFKVKVHMSADARQWKKDLLRSHGVTVIEYESDYSAAVKEGRKLSDADPKSYFVDDENSRTLFLGYAVAAKRLKAQLDTEGVTVDGEHPLFVYIPCGVGGAPGGISFGLKEVFGDAAHCFFVEPVQAPCMLTGMLTGLHNGISVQDIGLSGKTHADGLAVGRPSGFVGRFIEPMLSGEFTVNDAKLYDYMRDLLDTEGVFLEPSACAAFQGAALMQSSEAGSSYIASEGLADRMKDAVHIAWATGGSLVPGAVREEYRNTYL